jgi:hypothetical protein
MRVKFGLEQREKRGLLDGTSRARRARRGFNVDWYHGGRVPCPNQSWLARYRVLRAEVKLGLGRGNARVPALSFTV